jgi:hypothetical protein
MDHTRSYQATFVDTTACEGIVADFAPCIFVAGHKSGCREERMSSDQYHAHHIQCQKPRETHCLSALSIILHSWRVRALGNELQYALGVLTSTFQTALELAQHRAYITQPVQAMALH